VAAKIVPDRNAFTFTNYNLNISIEPARAAFTGRGTVTMRNDSAVAQQTAALQISSSLKWAGIKVAGKQIEFKQERIDSDIDHTGGVNEATFEWPQTIAPGASVEVEVAYQGTIRQNADRLLRLKLPPEVARASDWDGISESFTALRGVGHVVWYPVAIEPASLAERNKVFELLGQFRGRHAESAMKIELSVLGAPGGVLSKVLSTGTIENQDAATKNEVLGVHIAWPRLGLDGPLLVLGDFTATQNAAGTVYSLNKQDPGAASYASTAAKLLPTTLDFKVFDALVAKWIRAPQRKIQVIQLPDAKAAPFESGTVLLTPFLTNQKSIEFQLVHTLTHSAIYSFRPWIYEGLAHYSQARLIEVQEGRKGALAFLEQRRSALALDEPENQEGDASRSLINTTDEVLYRTKAMFVWWMLHEMIGDDPIQKALQAFKPEQDKEPSYIQRLLEDASHRNLDWFFNDWVYRDKGLPDFRITAVYPRQNLKGGYLVTVTVENLGNAGAEVPVRLITKEGEIVIKLEVMAKDKATARINSPLMPSEAIVNDGSVPESDLNNNRFTVASPK
jgi:hypothetical protein